MEKYQKYGVICNFADRYISIAKDRQRREMYFYIPLVYKSVDSSSESDLLSNINPKGPKN